MHLWGGVRLDAPPGELESDAPPARDKLDASLVEKVRLDAYPDVEFGCTAGEVRLDAHLGSQVGCTSGGNYRLDELWEGRFR